MIRWAVAVALLAALFAFAAPEAARAEVPSFAPPPGAAIVEVPRPANLAMAPTYTSVDIRGCSYAWGWCQVSWCADTGGSMTATWYTNYAGYNQYQTQYLTGGANCGNYTFKYFEGNRRGDIFTLYCPGACWGLSVIVYW